VVVPVAVSGNDEVQPAAAFFEQVLDPSWVVRGIDEQLLVGAATGQEIDVVGHGPDARFPDGQQGEVPLVAGAARGHLTRIVH